MKHCRASIAKQLASSAATHAQYTGSNSCGGCAGARAAAAFRCVASGSLD